MKSANTSYQQFEINWKLCYLEVVDEYRKRISKCRDEARKRIHDEYLNEVFDLRNKAVLDLGRSARFFLEIKDELERDKEKQFDIIFNQKIRNISENDDKLTLARLSQIYAYQEAINLLQDEGLKYQSKRNNDIATTIQWAGNTDLEFIQLIYGLFEIGYLTNEKKQITKLVEEVAAVFNYKLKKNWQTTLSDHIHNRNADHEPKIFGKLKEGFDKYREKQVNKRKKNSPK